MWTKYTSQHVTPSRVFDARSARMKLASVQRHKVGRNFVATTPPARGIPSCRRRISLVPPPYPSAVSKNVTPARAASSRIPRSVASEIRYPLIRRSSAVVPQHHRPDPDRSGEGGYCIRRFIHADNCARVVPEPSSGALTATRYRYIDIGL